jgi:hypothetical protein
MKFILFAAAICLLFLSETAAGQSDRIAQHSFSLVAWNSTGFSRPDEVTEIDLARIKMKFPSFNEKAFFIIYLGGNHRKGSFERSNKREEIPSQLSEEPLGCVGKEVDTAKKIIFICSFAPHEKKKFEVVWKSDTVEKRLYPKMTQAALGVKVDYRKVNGYYTDGKFVDVDSATVPADHFAHDALYRIEGPGWESDKIVYRVYMDSRNRNDIFGKRTHDLVLHEIGQNDLVSNSKESYANMLDWGMDIFKVGESLGIGSIAMWHDSKVVTVSDVEQIKCSVFNGAIRSGVSAKYFGWKVGGGKYDLFSNLSISARSRLTKVSACMNNDSVQLCTGLAKHKNCDLIKSRSAANVEWAYMALYGRQSLSGDNLGIAVLYRGADEVELTEDGASDIVVLRPVAGRLTYYFGAAWEDEPEGIKNEKEFKKYLDDTVLELSNPIQTYF